LEQAIRHPNCILWSVVAGVAFADRFDRPLQGTRKPLFIASAHCYVRSRSLDVIEGTFSRSSTAPDALGSYRPTLVTHRGLGWFLSRVTSFFPCSRVVVLYSHYTGRCAPEDKKMCKNTYETSHIGEEGSRF